MLGMSSLLLIYKLDAPVPLVRVSFQGILTLMLRQSIELEFVCNFTKF